MLFGELSRTAAATPFGLRWFSPEAAVAEPVLDAPVLHRVLPQIVDSSLDLATNMSMDILMQLIHTDYPHELEGPAKST